MSAPIEDTEILDDDLDEFDEEERARKAEVKAMEEEFTMQGTTSTVPDAMKGYDHAQQQEFRDFPREWSAVKDFQGENYLPKIATIIDKACAASEVSSTKSSVPFSATSNLRDMFRKEGKNLVVDHGSMIFKGTGRCASSHIAANLNQSDVLSTLISYNASVDAPDINNWTPLHTAANSLSVDCLKLLLSEKADPNKVSTPLFESQTPLARVVGSARTYIFGDDEPFSSEEELDTAVRKCVAALIEAKADVDHEDLRGRTLLHLAACAGRSAAIGPLMERGFKVDIVNDKDGNTPLHYACMYDRPLMVEQLLSLGADKKIKNKEGKMPADVASADAALALEGKYVPPIKESRESCCTIV